MGDDQGFFSLESDGHDEDGVLTAMLNTAADVVIDREMEVREEEDWSGNSHMNVMKCRT